MKCEMCGMMMKDENELRMHMEMMRSMMMHMMRSMEMGMEGMMGGMGHGAGQETQKGMNAMPGMQGGKKGT